MDEDFDEDINDDSSTLNHVSHRSTNFSKNEVKTLIELIEIHKNIILNKSTNNTTNHTKEITWAKIAKQFNNQGFKNKRSGENLRTKWENLKKEARKLSKNLISIECNEYKNENYFLLSEIIKMINEADKNTINVESPELNNEQLKDDYNNTFCDDDKCSDADCDSTRKHRTFNFSPQECSLLLQCVKTEKDYIFSKETTRQARKERSSAWSRVSNSFNKTSPQKRTVKMLQMKFKNMKKLAKKTNVMNIFHNGHSKLETENDSKIKSEPLFQHSVDMDSMSDDSEENQIDVKEQPHRPAVGEVELPDPLSTVLNGDLDSIHFGYLNAPQDKEMVQMQLELLKYQLDTAKIERQRIIERAEADRSERESKASEMSLRLRSARLELVAAEAKLPSSHSALQYGYGESKAKEYMQQFSNT